MIKTPNQLFFEKSAQIMGIPLELANRIIDGRYKPFLSALNDKTYDKGSTVWDAKYYALNDAIEEFGVEETIAKLKKVRN